MKAQNIVITMNGVKSIRLDIHKLGLDAKQTYKVI